MGTPIREPHYVGQRLSLKSQLCTVRYIGPVSGRPGDYLGVEWDDPTRGKHAGSHEGVSYFECRSRSRTAASFLKPGQPWDAPRTFLEALREKYMSKDDASSSEKVYFSGKEAEEIGFEKFAERQKRLLGIHVIVLDGMRIRHRRDDENLDILPELCSEITDLDLTSNLFESSEEILDLIQRLPKLSTLTLDRNRFTIGAGQMQLLPRIRTLIIRNCLLAMADASSFLSRFESVEVLSLANNEIIGSLALTIPPALKTLDLTDNELMSIGDVQLHGSNQLQIRNLILKRNRITAVGPPSSLSSSISNLDLSYNSISTWLFFNNIDKAYPNIRHLRVTGNPLYETLISAEGRALTAEDGYMLTIARLPGLETLNYSKITEKERLNAETYYLSQIALELSSVDEDLAPEVLARHPRYEALCEEYGEPTIRRQAKATELDPSSLAARFVKVKFELVRGFLPRIQARQWTSLVPRAFSMYTLLGFVAKYLDVLAEGLTPLDLRLVLETGEDVLADRDSGYAGPEWWDSDEEEVEDAGAADASARNGWAKQEVELVPGTRSLATYVDKHEASIRIERANDRR